MHANQRLANLRELLAARPSRDVWHRLCALLDAWPDRLDLSIALDYASEHLKSWPDRLRVAPAAWWRPVAERDADQPRLTLVRALELSAEVEVDAPLLTLARCPQLSDLLILKLSHCELLDDATLADLLSEPNLADLEELWIDGIDLTWDHLNHWEDIKTVPALLTLALVNDALEDDAIEALCGIDALASLVRLDLSSNHIGDEGARALARCPHLSALRQLVLRDNPIGEEGYAHLFEDPTFDPEVLVIEPGYGYGDG